MPLRAFLLGLLLPVNLVWAELPQPSVIYGAPPSDYFPAGIAEAKAQLLAGNPAGCLKLIDKTIAGWRHPIHLERVLLLKGFALQQSGDAEGTRAAFEEAHKLKPSDSDIMFVLAQVLDKPEDAPRKSALLNDAMWFNRFTLIQPIDAMNGLAESFVATNNTPQAIAAFEKAVASNPNSIAARQKLAELYLLETRKPEALAQLRAAQAAEPNNKSIRISLAKTLLSGANRQFDAADIAEAKQLAQNSLSENPADEATQVLIRSLMESGELPEAKRRIDLALKSAPQDIAVLRLAQQLKSEEGAMPTPSPQETPVSGR